MAIVVSKGITAGMATLDVMDVMVCITLIAAMSTLCLEAFVAAMLEPNCSDNCNGQRCCNGPDGYNGPNGYNGQNDCNGHNGCNCCNDYNAFLDNLDLSGRPGVLT